VEKIRLTGGEPLLTAATSIARAVAREYPRSPRSALTTNGSLLADFAQPLRDAGLHRITVSLDALDDATFRNMADADYP
jgi:cyclic pyranopterin phosphate synthase